MTNLCEAFRYGIGYDECMASLFLIPYFKIYYTKELPKLIDDNDPDFDTLQKSCIGHEDGPEKSNVVGALWYCVDKMRTKEYITDAKYQQYLNAIKNVEAKLYKETLLL